MILEEKRYESVVLFFFFLLFYYSGMKEAGDFKVDFALNDAEELFRIY